MSTVTRRRTRKLDDLREALLSQLEALGGAVSGAALVEEVALDQDAEPSRVVSAMWTLVDDGQVEYESGAKLRLLASH